MTLVSMPTFARITYKTNPITNAATGGQGILPASASSPGNYALSYAEHTAKTITQEIQQARYHPADGPDNLRPARR